MLFIFTKKYNSNNIDLNEIFTSQNILRMTQQVRVLELLQLVSVEVLAADLIFELFEVLAPFEESCFRLQFHLNFEINEDINFVKG